MITTQRKQVNKVKQIPTQYNYSVKLNNRLNRMAINTLFNRVLIIGLIISNIILFNKVNEVKVQPVIMATEEPKQEVHKTDYSVPNLPPIEDMRVK